MSMTWMLMLLVVFGLLFMGGLVLLVRLFSGARRESIEDDDLAALEQLNRGLQQMTRRVEAIETLLVEEPKKKVKEDSAVGDRTA